MASGTGDGTGAGTGAGAEAEASLSGVLNLTRGRRRDPTRVRTISDIEIKYSKRALLTENATRALYL